MVRENSKYIQPDKIVITHHLFHRVSESDGDGKREALGHGNHEHSDSDNQKSN
jgi:hypothetical protein